MFNEPVDKVQTPFGWSYITLAVCGNARFYQANGPPADHHRVIAWLIKAGAPVDTGDIAGCTALHHLSNRTVDHRTRLALLVGGANPNAQDRYGTAPAHGAIMEGQAEALDILLEYGARLDLGDADNITPLSMSLNGGPKIAAVIQKWRRKREKVEAPPLQEKDRCGKCDKLGAKSACARCRAMRYCSAECQSASKKLYNTCMCSLSTIEQHWKTHKPQCVPFTPDNTIVVKPTYTYKAGSVLLHNAAFVRKAVGTVAQENISTKVTGTERGKLHTPMIIKIQLATFGRTKSGLLTSDGGPMLVYDRKKKFLCEIDRATGVREYDALVDVIKRKGCGGAKGYFAAELLSQDRLTIKIGELVAEQPW